MMNNNLKGLLKIFLMLVALHSFCVGVGLIAIPLKYVGIFGFESYSGSFFKIQGGVFHIVMCGAYLPAALNPVRHRSLLAFSIFAKFTATVFLFSFTFIGEKAWMVILSGAGDLLMGLILLWFYRKGRRE